MKPLEVFEEQADRLPPALSRRLADIKARNVNGGIGAAPMFKAMSDAVDSQVLKLDGLQQQYVAPYWGRLTNSEVMRVRRVVQDVKAAIERAAEEA